MAKKKTLIPKVVAITAARNTTKVSQRTSVAEWETKLQKDLFLNYQRDVHPSKVNNDGSPEPITVTFDVQVIRIIKLVSSHVHTLRSLQKGYILRKYLLCVWLKFSGGGRGGDTFKPPSPVRTTFAFTHPCFKMFLERSLNDPTPHHPTSSILHC